MYKAKMIPLLQSILNTDNGSSDPALPPLPQFNDYSFALVKMFVTMCALIALFVLTYWLLRKLLQNRINRSAAQYAIQILERRALSPKTILYLIEVENKKILVAESQLEIKTLQHLSPSDQRSE